MNLEEEFDDLQRLFAQKDLLTEPRRSSGNGFIEVVLVKRENMKLKIYEEQGHRLPHIHIDYGKQHHVATYAIETGERIEGSLSKKYDSDVSDWLERNRSKVLEIWRALQAGKPYEPLLADLVGDV